VSGVLLYKDMDVPFILYVCAEEVTYNL